ncbi:glycoside hydrolase [Meredithblackwellia eburnea MCA 4105]
MSTIHSSVSDPAYAVGSSKSAAHDLSNVKLRSEGRFFKDQYNRTLLLRGVNLSGLNKLPTTPNGFTHLSDGFWDTEGVSFVGRPFPLDEAPDHLARLRQWGLTFVRFVVTWEALEHEGPGIYDQDYISYLHALISLFPSHGIKCYIDPHQDVWSRHTGGSGAPHWTLDVVGLEIRNLKATGAAHAHNLHLGENDPPPKVWPSGYCKLAAATMATLFWAGETFAPKRTVKWSRFRTSSRADNNKKRNPEEDVNVQTFLQHCMIEAFGVLADRLKDCDAVVGFEVMNEPHRGYIELHSPFSWDFNTDLAIGYFPSAVQGWALGSGHSIVIDHYVPRFPVTGISHQVLLSPPQGRRAWKEGVQCVWEEHGVWGWDAKRGEGKMGQPVLLKHEYFSKTRDGKDVEWYRDFYWPFCQKFGDRIGRANSSWRTMVGPIPNEFCPEWPATLQPREFVYAPHFYDLQALFSKALGEMSANVQGLSRGMFLLKALYFGRSGLKKNYATQIRNILNSGLRSIGELPLILGETGVPFDLNGRNAFDTGDFHYQERMMDAICSACESNLVNFNLWNYNPLNNDEWGDSWNSENFCWYSESDRTPAALKAVEGKGEDERLNVGARVLNAVERPYACKVAGIPLSTSFEMTTLDFTLSFANPLPGAKPLLPQRLADTRSVPLDGKAVAARETEIFLPRRRYAKPFADGKLKVKIGKGDGEWRYDPDNQTLYYLHMNVEPGHRHEIKISVEGVPRPARGRGIGLLRREEWVALVVLLVAVLARATVR